MMKCIVLALCVASTSSLGIRGSRDADLIKDELYPSSSDGTRLDAVCSGEASTQNFIFFKSQGEEVTEIIVVPTNIESGNAIESYTEDFTSVLRNSGFTINFRPKKTGKSIRQAGAVIRVMGRAKFGGNIITLFTFGIGSTAFGPQVTLQDAERPNLPVTEMDMGVSYTATKIVQYLLIVNDASCPYDATDVTLTGGGSLDDGFFAELFGSTVILTFTPAKAGSYVAELTVSGTDASLKVDLSGVRIADSPTPPPTVTCDDYTFGGEAWFDTGGSTFNCDYYKGNNPLKENKCDKEGDLYKNFGVTANTACCACPGGGATAGNPQPAETDPPTPVDCVDMTLADGSPWNDDGGVEYSCAAHYAKEAAACAAYGNLYGNYGATANQACCACPGGGVYGGAAFNTLTPPPTPDTSNCDDKTGPNGQVWRDSYGGQYTCAYYAANNKCDDWSDDVSSAFFGLTGRSACCTCGGGTPAGETAATCVDAVLADGSPWRDSFGVAYKCSWYALQGNGASRCAQFGGEGEFEGKTANSACCTCKYGS